MTMKAILIGMDRESGKIRVDVGVVNEPDPVKISEKKPEEGGG